MLRKIVENVTLRDASRRRGLCGKRVRRELISNRRQAGIERNRLGLRTRKFHAVILGRVVRSRNHDAAVEIEFADRKVECVGRDHTNVDDVGPRFTRAARKGLAQSVAGWAHVAPHYHTRALRPNQWHEAASNGVGRLLAQLGRINAANVVGLENRGVDLRLHGLPFFDRAPVTPL
jgi:hypothetical protein